ncbi:hypothetical protein AWB78_08636 [Caballeronia calidae]|uniref:DUF86 domain-containing protein n=1 Tax=Caballeronia calidae TaxID=1777139 RepID=A0A158ELG1_9BURK|nr:DUF86 domain-containing protein [Caballeronia calidae]SAL07570.1 hypothetical protein AWB78_08636 [Caballeronia calidae]
MSNKEPRLHDYLGHIVEAIARIEGYISDMPKEVFVANQLLIDAVVRNIEIVGEASNRVTKHHREFRDAHPEVEWRGSYEMRSAIAHDYFKVDLDLVWNTVKNDLPAMRETVQGLLDELNAKDRPAVPRPRM